MSHDERRVFVLADQALQRVVDQIGDGQWQMNMPAEFQRRQTDKPVTLREIINYHAYDEAWVPDMLAGLTMAEAGQDKFQGDLLGDDPKASFAALVAQACAAVQGLDDFQRTVHCSFGDYSAQEYLWQISGFRGLRANDIAKVIGVDPTLPDELVEGLWAQIEPQAEELRGIGVFAPKVQVPESASLQDRLLGLTGRQPNG
ncbi:MAG: TIGR03086 family metal-binding protein [Candidatus Dormibacter sp.]|uniref:TIGR03086 family metal-binding protein n=1 Tax=Candidatus Dormibacter sp. TaxID=2973982 RepID=UPI000DB0660A|nr:MAG: TIGR03086 family protein [Candidatus Dormibacteraeota bacterium]